MSVPSIYMVGSRVIGSSAGVFAILTPSSVATPLVLSIDFTDVPVGQGTGTGIYDGENGLGGYLTIYGLGFGTQGALGTSFGARVFIGGQEIANYRYLVNTLAYQNGREVRPFQALGVQIGSAAVKALTLGTAYPVSVVVSGVASNANDIDGNPLLMTPIKAPVIYVDEQNGSESNLGTFASPKQHFQTWPGSGSVMTGVTGSQFGWNPATQTPGIIPGTQCVGRQGTGGYIWTYSATFEQRLVNLFRCTGTSPNGNASGGGVGINNGSLKYTSYPGPINGNAPEVVQYQQGIANKGGGFNGNDTARAQETTPFGFVGWCQNIAMSNMSIAINAGAASSDACPVNLQNSAKQWKITNMSLTWPSTLNNGSGSGPLGAGISGNAIYSAMLNDIYDIFDVSGGFQNHGIYLDASLIYCRDCIAAYNCMTNISGGNGLQIFTNKFSGLDDDGFAGATNISVHHNYVNGTGKYGYNFNISTLTAKLFCNVAANVTRYNFIFGGDASPVSSGGTGPVTVIVVNNTFYGTAGAGLNCLVENDYKAVAGLVELRNNLTVMGATRSDIGLAFYGNDDDDTAWVPNSNGWYDPQGHTTAPPFSGTGEIYANPLFITPYTNFGLLPGSPFIGAATLSANYNPVYDFMLNPMTRAGQTKNSIGAFG